MPEGPPETPYARFRGLFLSARPNDLHIAPTTDLPRVWAGMMELGMPGGVASMVAIADGAASLYLSTGGAVIGGHAHENVRAAVRRFLVTLERSLEVFAVATTFAPPTAGKVSFTVRSYEADLAAEAPESDFAAGGHRLSAAFLGGHDVLTELRLVAQGTSKRS